MLADADDAKLMWWCQYDARPKNVSLSGLVSKSNNRGVGGGRGSGANYVETCCIRGARYTDHRF